MSAPRLAVRAILALALFACVLAAPPVAAQDSRESTVQQAARDWLAIVDRGDYKATWDAAGSKFRLAITPERWSEAIAAVRGPLGALAQRSVLKTTFTRSFPGVPDGDYALVVFRTAFEKKTEGDETVTLEHEPDGAWRVVGYFIR
jgi:hypothetical protein